MAKKQAELPGTRRDDEPEMGSIAVLDTACEEFERARGKAIKAAQAVVEAKRKIDELLREHKIREYPYEGLNGVEKKVFLSESVKAKKIKRETTSDDGDDE